MLYLYTLLAISFCIPETLVYDKSDSKNLVVPRHYFDEFEKTGGAKCNNGCDCTSNICNQFEGNKVCICHKYQARPNCSHRRTSYYFIVNMLIFFPLLCLGSIPWFILGYTVIGIICMIPLVVICAILISTKISNRNNIDEEFRKTSVSNILFDHGKLLSTLYICNLLFNICAAILVATDNLHDSKGYGLY